MSAVDSRATDVARAAGFDARRLDAFLRDAVPGLTGTMRLARIGGGQSNPTFFVDYDARALVLRKQPPGELLVCLEPLGVDLELAAQTLAFRAGAVGGIK